MKGRIQHGMVGIGAQERNDNEGLSFVAENKTGKEVLTNLSLRFKLRECSKELLLARRRSLVSVLHA